MKSLKIPGACVKNQPSQDVLQGYTAEEELGLAHLVDSDGLVCLLSGFHQRYEQMR